MAEVLDWLDNVIFGSCAKMYLDDTGKKTTIKKGVHYDMKEWSKLSASKVNPNHEVVFALTGEKSGIVVVDFDTLEQYEDLINRGIFSNPTDYPTVKTRRGVHVYFKYTDKLHSLNEEEKKVLNVDIQGNGKRVYYPGTTYKIDDKNCFTYQWKYKTSLKDIPMELLEYINSCKKDFTESSPPNNITDISLSTFNESLCNLIDEQYINDREHWLKIIFAMKRSGISESFAHQWSLKATKCKILLDDDWNTTWNSEDNRDKGVGIGTIKYYAKLSNPIEYNKLTNKNAEEAYNNLINKPLHTEYDIALLFDIVEGDNVVYVKDTDSLYVWCNDKWFLDEVKSGAILKTLISTNYYYYFETKKQLIISEINKLESTEEDTRPLNDKLNKIKKIMDCLRTTSHKSNIAKEIIGINLVKASCIEFDNNPNLLGFKTKKLDLTTGKFSNIEYKDYITMSTGYNYVEPKPEQYEVIKTLFEEVFPNEEIRKSFLSVLYNSLIGGQKEKFTIARGEGGNGKGVIMELIKLMLGDYAYSAPVSLITKEMRGGANPEVANLNRKRLVVMKEPSATDKLWLSNIKQLVGNTDINARGLYSGNTKCVLEGTIILETNHSLNFNGKAGDAEMRRFIEIMFESTFTDDKTMINDPTLQNVYEKKDLFITSSFREEYKSVLLKYILDNAEKSIYVPDCVKQQTSQYIDNQNSFKFWLEDNYELTQDDTDVVKVKDMFNLYTTSEEYRNTNREHRPNLHKFTLDFVRSDKKLKNKYRDRYRPTVGGTQKEVRSVLLGIKEKLEEIDD